MNSLTLFLPCAAGVEGYLAQECQRILGGEPTALASQRGGVSLQASWSEMMQLNLRTRFAQRVLIQVKSGFYRAEEDLYTVAKSVPWEMWFKVEQTFKVEITAQYSPLKSLNFAALKVKDAVADRFRDLKGSRPSVDVKWPHVRVYVHLTQDQLLLSIDTSGEPLFKRGWRLDKGEAPLKETLAAAMLAASGWEEQDGLALYDPCCGSGTIAIEAAQMDCHIAPGIFRKFGFENLLPFQASPWQTIKNRARQEERAPTRAIFGSDVSHRMVDFAQQNAERAGVAHAIEFRGGDALVRMPPQETPGMLMVNPPYDERMSALGVAGAGKGFGRERAQMNSAAAWEHRSPSRDPSGASVGALAGNMAGDLVGAPAADKAPASADFFSLLASHWKKNFSGWQAWVLTPNLKLPGQMRLKESRRVPLWNGPIECRMFKFDMVKGSNTGVKKAGPEA